MPPLPRLQTPHHVRRAPRRRATAAAGALAAGLLPATLPPAATIAAAEPPAGATYVLVAGGWHGGWCWRDVAARLRAAGHAVWTPTLTGLGERSHLLTPEVDLALHVQDVSRMLEYEDLHQVILVGHSYGGMVVAGVSGESPQRLAHAVYLDAFVPEDGQSLFDLLRPERRDFYREQARTLGEGWRVPAPPAAALGVTAAAAAAWLTERMTPQPLRTFEQPVRLPATPAAPLPRTYLRCTAGPLVPSFAPFGDRAQTEPGWRYAELDTGHDAMVTVPEALAGLLLEVAAQPA